MTPAETVEERARVLLDRLGMSNTADGLPDHVVYRLAMVADPADLAYLDMTTPKDGGYEVVALTTAGLLVRLDYQVPQREQGFPDPPPNHTAETCTMRLEPLRGRVAGIELSQQDLRWEGAALVEKAMTILVEEAEPIVLPLTRQRDGVDFVAAILAALALT